MRMSRPVNRMRAVHPGEVLREEYLAPLELSVNALAIALGVPATRIHEIVKERRGITADTAERLARYFGGDAASWLASICRLVVPTTPATSGSTGAPGHVWPAPVMTIASTGALQPSYRVRAARVGSFASCTGRSVLDDGPHPFRAAQ